MFKMDANICTYSHAHTHRLKNIYKIGKKERICSHLFPREWAGAAPHIKTK